MAHSWHQATLFYLVTNDPQDEPMRQWAPAMFASSVVMVAVQCATALAVCISTFLPSCQTSDQCSDGSYCQVRL